MPLFALLISEQFQYYLLWNVCFDKIRVQLAVEMGQIPTSPKVWLEKAVSQKKNLAEIAMNINPVVYVCVACKTSHQHVLPRIVGTDLSPGVVAGVYLPEL